MSDQGAGVPGMRLALVIAVVAVVAVAALRVTRSMLVDGTDIGVSDHRVNLGDLAWPDMRVDVNKASAAELRLLPGIGPRLAERIVDDRMARGPFASVSDLARVPGIGPRTIERLAGLCVVTTTDAVDPRRATAGLDFGG